MGRGLSFAKAAVTAVAAGLMLLLAPVGTAPAAAQPDDGMLRLSLGYDGKLLVKVLDMQIEQRVTATGFGANARLVSTGILRLLKNVDERASSQGRIASGKPRPGSFEYQHLSSKQKRKVHVTWSQGDVEMTTTPVPFPDLGYPPATLQQKLASADPLTQLMRMTLNASRTGACRESHLFFDGKQLYSLDFSNQRAAPPSSREAQLGLANTVRCDVRFREVAGFGKKDPSKRDQGLKKPIEVDFAQAGASGPWVISRIHTQTPLGWATIELKRMTISGKDPTT